MIPKTPPFDRNGNIPVREVDPTGLTAWVDYIPIQVVSEVAGQEWRAESDGFYYVRRV